MPKGEYDIITLRLRKGDREAIRTYFHPLKYNDVVRTLVAKAVDSIRSTGSNNVEIKLSAEDVEV